MAHASGGLLARPSLLTYLTKLFHTESLLLLRGKSAAESQAILPLRHLLDSQGQLGERRRSHASK